MSQEQEERAALIAANKGHYDAIDFALEVRGFLGSRLGQYLVQRAEEERENAMGELVDADPLDSGKIMKLQSDIKRAESVQLWMAELIQEGVSAQEQLLTQDAISNADEAQE
jgi:hypothetical protein